MVIHTPQISLHSSAPPNERNLNLFALTDDMSVGIGFGFYPSAEAFVGSMVMDGDEYVRCGQCGFGGCDLRVSPCGCTSHARCLSLNTNGNGPLQACPLCGKQAQSLVLFPMSFREIDDAQRTAAALPKRSRKRKGDPSIPEPPSTFNERRTGRWTNEEMAYCDKLMAKFASGELPVSDGVKLNEFLGSMLKSKQSRLTKKMKNAKLSTKLFQRSSGVIGPAEVTEFSELEEGFYQSITDVQERAEIKFHMQKEWREQFSRVCLALGQPLDSDSWLSSVEEMDRRASQAKDAARMTRRKLMMGVAMHADSRNMPSGVFMEKTDADERVVGAVNMAAAEHKDVEKEMLALLSNDKHLGAVLDSKEQSSLLHSAPFLAKVTSYLQRHSVPFEHCDLWVPSFVPGESADGTEVTTCRLCYAGNSTTTRVIRETVARDLSQDELFNYYSFGDYSQKFSFNIGAGLPGRVYDIGRSIWELSVHKAPQNLFERCGGANQWGVKTVVGIPIASPNVGRIVVVLYSREDRKKDEDLVTRLSDEFTKLMPSPKWKLVVDIGDVEEHSPESTDLHDVNVTDGFDNSLSANNGKSHEPTSSHQQSCVADPFDGKDNRADQVVSLLGKYMPSDPHSPLASVVPGFMSLRLLLLRSFRTPDEEELVSTMLDSYSSYTSGGRDESDIAVMLARDYLFLTQQQQAVGTQQLHIEQEQHSLGNAVEDTRAGGVASSPADPGGLSLFGQPSPNSNQENSPALTPIPVGEVILEPLSLHQLNIIDGGSGDCLSVVST